MSPLNLFAEYLVTRLEAASPWSAADVPRELPFSHAGFGQDVAWVAANFTNAIEILAVGYPQWVDQQVGVGLTNGLYKFTATIGDHELNSYLDGFTYGTNSTPQVHLSLDAPDTILVDTNIYINAVSGLLSLSMTVDRFRKIQPVRQGLRF